MQKKKLVKNILASVILAITILGQIATPVSAFVGNLQQEAKKNAEETSITLQNQFLEFYEIGESKNIGATAKDINAQIVYASSDETKATVDSTRKCYLDIAEANQ